MMAMGARRRDGGMRPVSRTGARKRGGRVGGAMALALGVLLLAPASAWGIPHFARQYDVACSQCHASPPKLNAFGEDFRASGYSFPGREPRQTFPLAVWASGRWEPPGTAQAPENAQTYVNRVELVSGGRLFARWLSYFVEWRALSLESRADGTLRDRSGRFEDLFVTASRGGFDVTVGQYRQVEQVDVSLRMGLSEPLALSASLPGGGEGTARERSLRGFAPAARSPAIRGGWTAPVGGGWEWTTTASLPLPGELSLPLTSEARVEASNEIEWRPKGVVGESYLRRGTWSFGGHAFAGTEGRLLGNAVATGEAGILHWTAIAGARRQGGVVAGQWSAEAQLIPHYFAGFGARLEDRAADPAPVAFIPYVNLHFPGTRYTVRLTVEQRVQRGRGRTLVELGTVF
jgi:hypothetical protein